MSRTDQIKKAILKQLQQAKGYATPETALQSQVEWVVPKLTRAEFELALKDCDANGWINGTTPAMGDRKWGITDEGMLVLAGL